MKKGKLLGLICAVIVIAGLLIAGCAGPPPAQPAPGPEGPGEGEPAHKILKIGAVGPLSGFVAPWGINQIRGNDIWAECINDGRLSKFSENVLPTGGLKLGGEVYDIDLIKYDDKYEAAVTLESIKKLAMVDDVKFVFPSITFAAGALGDLCQSLGMVMLQVAGDPNVIGPGRSLVFNANNDENCYTQAETLYALTTHPDAKRIALISPDISAGRYAIAYAWKVCHEQGREVVFDKLYPLDTVDYHPFMASVLASKPDMIIGACAWPNDTALCIEAAYQAGYKGYWCTNTYVLSLILPRVPAEAIEGYSGGWVYGGWTDSPNCPEEARWYKAQWDAKHGDEEWTTSSPANYAANRVLQAGMEAADSIDPVEVAAAMQKLNPVPHPAGQAQWAGAHWFGIDNGLFPPMMCYEIRGGKYETATIYSPPYPWDFNLAKIPGIPKIYTDEVLKVWGRLD